MVIENSSGELSGRLDRLLFQSFYDGYVQGAVAVANGAVVVEKLDHGYCLKDEKDVSENTTTPS